MIISTIAILTSLPSTVGYSFIPSISNRSNGLIQQAPSRPTISALKMVDAQTLQVAGISVAGLATGIGMLAFTDTQAERSNERGGLTDGQTNKIVGGLVVEEVEDGKDAGSLASQLETALKQSGTLSEEAEEEILDGVGKDYDGGDGW